EVSNSYGGGELGFGSTERAAYNHVGIPIVASTGDDGYYSWDSINEGFFGLEMPNAPSSLPSVVAVGGTSLLLNSDGTRASESVWNGNGPEDKIGEKFPEVGASGGGCSLIDTANGWQQDVANFAATGCGTKRLDADVSAVADPVTGLDIFDSYACGSACSFPKVEGGWVTLGGTSLSAPLVSALYALAGGGGGANYPSLTLYGHSGDAAARYDVTEGGNGYCGGETVAECGHANSFGAGDIDCEGTTACNASPGFDGPSGVGTPNGLGLFELQSPVATMLPPSTLSAGSAAGFSLSLSDAYPGGAPASASWSWGDGTGAGGLSPSHTYAAPGAYTVTLTVTDVYGLSSAPVTRQVTVGPGVGGGGGGGTGGGQGGTTTTTTTSGGSQQGVASFQSTTGSAHLASSSLKVSSGSVKLTIACAASGGSCSGTVTLTAPSTGHASVAKAKAKTLTLGKASFKLAAGKTLTVTLHLSRQALAQLARAHSLHATATIILSSGGGAARTVRSTVTLHAAAPARHSH
ncbi:MAG TPA: PKD domain-containing protein, partial [Solirubrobacteraceae bacterium]